ncbi:MAG: DUF3261 domain-containing protein [Deltaproteobacteria bacterium]|nr:DUF3261 domain-containing protein [Deltaproteobacteria bacterium]
MPCSCVRFNASTPASSSRVEAAVEVRDGKLVVAAFTPFGTRAFAITQEGREISIEGELVRHKGVRPTLLLDALHRALFLPSPDTTPWRWHEEWVEEHRVDGRLERRVFRPADPDTEDENAAGARVEYRVLETIEALEIQNDWCPYEAQVVILARSHGPAPEDTR